ncbi:MAG TPA: enoyl-CoA hydratase/isomerase family protein, partial [Burkholderiaceae bacterium]
MTATLQISRDGAVARVFLNRPDVRNAFNDAVI